MSESLKVLHTRWLDMQEDLRKSIVSTTSHMHVELNQLDELSHIHNLMITDLCNLIDQVEAELIQTTQTIKYVSETTNKLKGAING